jgi:uncharacterized protein YeaO (DUF488 family)
MGIKTKSIFQQPEVDDGLRILITRFYPRGIKKGNFDYWMQELSPSTELLTSYKTGICDWNTFKHSFLNQMANNIDSLEALYVLHEQSVHTDMTLLCYEKNGTPCHRHLIRDLVEYPDYLDSFKSKNTDNKKRIPISRLITY